MNTTFHEQKRFPDCKPAVGAYKEVLSPPTSKCDVTYWLNYLAEERQTQRQGPLQNESSNNRANVEKIAAINTAGKISSSVD